MHKRTYAGNTLKLIRLGPFQPLLLKPCETFAPNQLNNFALTVIGYCQKAMIEAATADTLASRGAILIPGINVIWIMNI